MSSILDGFPDRLTGKHEGFSRLATSDPLCSFLQEPFTRVPGKTDTFAVYQGKGFRDQLQIILHSPETFERTQRGGSDRVNLARKSKPWSYRDILTPNELASLASPEVLPAQLRETLWYDGVAEGDSLHFFNAVAKIDKDLPAEFWPVLLLWLRDEINHRDGFREIYRSIYGRDAKQEDIESKQKHDFAPLDRIMCDPFALLVSLMYDESATIIGYHKDLPQYRVIGESIERFVRRVNADEGWHFQKFLNLAALHYPDRVNDLDYILDTVITEADKIPYAGTFIFDRGESGGAKRFEETERRQVKTMIKHHLLTRIKKQKV